MLVADIDREAKRLRDVWERIGAADKRVMEKRRLRITALARTLATLGYTETLARGYAVVRGDGNVVTGKAQAKKAGALEIEFADGKLAVVAGAAPKPEKKPTKKDMPPEQGSLL